MVTDGHSNRHSLQLCYSMQHQPYLLMHARQCCHILGEQASCPAESLLQTHIYIHKTCQKFFSEVKDSHKRQTSRFAVSWPAVPSLSNCQQWTSEQAKRAPESKESKATESTITQVHFQYCSTGFTLTSNKEPTSTKAVLGRILLSREESYVHKNWPLSMFSVTCFILQFNFLAFGDLLYDKYTRLAVTLTFHHSSFKYIQIHKKGFRPELALFQRCAVL